MTDTNKLNRYFMFYLLCIVQEKCLDKSLPFKEVLVIAVPNETCND